ncbi:MAG: hypothetical protein SGI71_01080 [Verrucomicrobiota bacterium]|nr:hypothetical protein [Verrucomicrobiota bacterium]
MHPNPFNQDPLSIVDTYEHVLPRPAQEWTDGHVLGNGDIGAVVWGNADRISLGLSKHNVWELTHISEVGNRWALDYPDAVRRVMKGEREFLWNIKNKGTPPYPNTDQIFQLACGALDIDLLRGQPSIRFDQRLSYSRGQCEILAEPSPCGNWWGMDYRPISIKTYVHADANALIVELSSTGAQCLKWQYARPSGMSKLPVPTYSIEEFDLGVRAVMHHKLNPTDHYSVEISAESGFEASASPHGLSGTLAFGGEKGPARLIVKMYAARDSKSVAQVTKTHALDEQSHIEWWRSFWSKCWIDYANKDFGRLWYFGTYALACATRPHTSPAHLQGIWNQFEIPPWHTDYHFNVNVQESHWSATRANHPELQAALVRCLIHDWREQLRRFAKEEFSADGVAISFAVDWLGRSLGGWAFDVEVSCIAWAAQSVWWHYEATCDEQYLRDDAFPFLLECCAFYKSIMVVDNNQIYNIELSHAPEQLAEAQGGVVVPGRNPAVDVAFIRDLLDHTLEAARHLKIWDAEIDGLEYMREHLPQLPTLDGVLIDHQISFFPHGDQPGQFKWCHRHASRLSAIFPCEQLHLNSNAEDLELARRSLREFWSYGDELFTGWSLAWQVPLCARVGFAEEAEKILADYLAHYTYLGLISSHNHTGKKEGPLFQGEAMLGIPAGLQEMMLQFTSGILRLFPAVPLTRSARFHQFRLPGGILVSAAKSKLRVDLHIQAKKQGSLRIHDSWSKLKLSLTRDDGVIAHFDAKNHLFEVPLEAGEKWSGHFDI